MKIYIRYLAIIIKIMLEYCIVKQIIIFIFLLINNSIPLMILTSIIVK